MKGVKRAFFLLLVLFLYSCATTQTPVAVAEKEPEKLQEIAKAPDFVTIIAVGDNLFHTAMIQSGEEGDYGQAYLEILPLIKNADIAFINQETLLAGKEYGFSGYPLFNTPQQVGRALSSSGFNLVNHATNHIMDKGEKAVFATMDFWDTIPELTILGIHRSGEERALPCLIKKNNVTLGFLSYTYGTNGIRVPGDKPYLVSLINTEIMAEEIDAIRPLCDFLVVSMHWGEEYRHVYSKNQEILAAFLAEHSVDLVIGHHPHFVQPVEYIERPDGKNMLCFYSLGNLISAQILPPTMLGAMAYIKIKKDSSTPEAGFDLVDAGAIPLVTHYEKNYSNFKVYPLYAYTEELAEKHVKKEITLNYLKDLAVKVLGDKEMLYNPFMPGPER